jgi:pyruvate dehydrogenase E1 component alpha subunit
MDTYRYQGHSMSDPGKYRTKDEIKTVKDTRDPVVRCREVLATYGVGDEELKETEVQVKKIVAEAVVFAQTSPEPDPSELMTDILV